MSKNRDDDYVATKVEKSFDDDGNTVVAELDKKTTLSSVLDGSGKKSTGLIRPEKGKPFNIKKILLGKENVLPFKKKNKE